VTAGGTYTLLLSVPTATTLEVGALGECRVPAGTCAYTGSALGSGGFARVDRHRRVARGDHDVRHWHVDYLAGDPNVSLVGVVTSPADAECRVARALPSGPVDGFGASDCGCRSHLAHASDAAALRERTERAHAALGG
jgi:Uri superfamily endonuclease